MAAGSERRNRRPDSRWTTTSGEIPGYHRARKPSSIPADPTHWAEIGSDVENSVATAVGTTSSGPTSAEALAYEVSRTFVEAGLTSSKLPR